MKKFLVAAGFAALFIATPYLAQSTPESRSKGADGSDNFRPGAVGPGSENNAVVSPTSPDVPASKQAPPDILAPSESNGGASGTPGPTNPAPPASLPQD